MLRSIQIVAPLLMPCALPAQSARNPSFEVSTVKPTAPDNTDQSWDSEGNRITIQNHTLRQLIKVPYGLKSDAQILSGPEWLDKQRFDISAKIDEEEWIGLKKLAPQEAEKETAAMLQSLLRERFQLKVKWETRPLPSYALVVNGPKSKLTPTGDNTSHSRLSIRNGHLTAVAVSMDALTDSLTRFREIGTRVVLNRTALPGTYTFELNWTPDRGTPPPPDATDPGLFTALRDQLGLKLEMQTAPVQVLVIEAAAQPVFD